MKRILCSFQFILPPAQNLKRTLCCDQLSEIQEQGQNRVCIERLPISCHCWYSCYGCSFTKLYLPLWNPMNYSMPGVSVLHYHPEFAQTHVCWVSDAIQPSHRLVSPFSSCPQSFSASGSFPMSLAYSLPVTILNYGNLKRNVVLPLPSRDSLFIRQDSQVDH